MCLCPGHQICRSVSVCHRLYVCLCPGHQICRSVSVCHRLYVCLCPGHQICRSVSVCHSLYVCLCPGHQICRSVSVCHRLYVCLCPGHQICRSVSVCHRLYVCLCPGHQICRSVSVCHRLYVCLCPGHQICRSVSVCHRLYVCLCPGHQISRSVSVHESLYSSLWSPGHGNSVSLLSWGCCDLLGMAPSSSPSTTLMVSKIVLPQSMHMQISASDLVRAWYASFLMTTELVQRNCWWKTTLARDHPSLLRLFSEKNDLHIRLREVEDIRHPPPVQNIRAVIWFLSYCFSHFSAESSCCFWLVIFLHFLAFFSRIFFQYSLIFLIFLFFFLFFGIFLYGSC